ncbi:DUF2905 domain-containing protein [Bacillus daqingensis]|uniref:DUF2905 domain-containing protein n=1 Tax=Bacillus daqingensis TaxID=872396 RepID=A0ABV9NY34_9BACI
MTIPKMLIAAGVVLIIAGVLWQLGGRVLPFGRLPGDIVIERGNSTFYFPLMTSIVISVLLSLIFLLFRR